MEGGKVATARRSATRRLGAAWKKRLKGAGGGVGGLAVMALVGLVAFVCGVAVLTLAAFSLTDLRHTHLSFVSADCTIIDHIATTRTRCSHGCTLPCSALITLCLHISPEGVCGVCRVVQAVRWCARSWRWRSNLGRSTPGTA